MEIIIFLIIGALAGFAAGLFGVGGGTIIVPLLFIVFTQMGYSPDVIMHLALGTSLATIIVTSISSLMAHNKKGAVMWPVVTNLAPGMALGCFFGAGIAGWLSSGHLQIIVGIFLLWVALKMFRSGKKLSRCMRRCRLRPSSLPQGQGLVWRQLFLGLAVAV